MTAPPPIADTADRLRRLGIRRVRSFAWRNFGDADAGGSEVMAHEVMRRWAAVGIDVEHRTAAIDTPRTSSRTGYWVVQRGTRRTVFGRVLLRELLRRDDPTTVMLEIWNGMPWGSPLWGRPRHVVWLHHVHRQMWADVLPRPIAAIGRLVETGLAPPLYRSSRIVTLSPSAREEIGALGLDAEAVSVIPPGVAAHFRPDEARRSPTPLVVSVGRLSPTKRVGALLAAAATARQAVPDLRVEVIGDGPERERLDQWVAAHHAHDWVSLRGRVDDAAVVHAYQRAWLVASASQAEGWGMTLTEAAACATPAVASDIAGHRDAVQSGATGIVVPPDAMAAAIVDLMSDHGTRRRYGARAAARARTLSWDDAAARHLDVIREVVEAQVPSAGR